MILTSVLSLFILLILTHLFQNARRRNKNLPPGPVGLPWIGYLPFINAKAPYETLSSLVSKYGKVYSVQMGDVLCVVLADAHLVRKYFSKAEFSGRAPLAVTFGIMENHGLICSEGERWKITRQLTMEFMRKLGMIKVTPGQSGGKVEEELMKSIRLFLKELKSESNDINRSLSHIMGNLMNEIIFGMSYERNCPTWTRLQQLREDGIKELNVCGAANFLKWLTYIPSIKRTIRWIKEGQRESHEEYAKISERNFTEGETPTFTDYYRERKKVMSEDKKELLSDKQLHFVQADLFGAGLDTTLTTIKWCILYLAKHQEVQKTIWLEIKETVQDDMVSFDYLNRLPITESFILEVQRLRPVVPLGVPHGTVSDTKLEEWDIPKGTMLMPLHWYINRDPEIWKEPDSFNPRRFLNASGKGTEIPLEFIPFQHGLRRCVGAEFGRVMALLFIANLIKSFKICLTDKSYDLNQTPDHGFTLSPKPFEIDVTQRF